MDEMTTIVQSKGLPSESIVLEVTETSLMSNLAPSLGTLARLRLNGFGLAMDDHGTGYSSMKQLSRSPFTELKIDREFVHDASSSPKKLAILTSAIAMCQKLQLSSVAEGVETESDRQQLAALGCDVAQGYHYSRPLSEEMFMLWMQERGA
nr:EAL domain-containing protein [Chromobacterium amazonense]MDQ4539807.1 EAL domain-containing protein [Chromobacterium amazonense]